MAKKAKRALSEVISAAPHDDRWLSDPWRTRVRRRLLRWFKKNARSLPWRDRASDPYSVWLSEVMLQQTQVSTVIPYFNRFLEKFPTVTDLAAAEEATVLQLWEGLGYYRRARQLHAAAKQIVESHGGKFPTQYDDVLALPGIGRYTAGAILSISTGQRLPIVEANTQRLYSRLIASTNHPTDKAANALLWEFAERILPRRDSGQFNQAAMELGALVCTPQQPDCPNCPLQSCCAAHEKGLETIIPGKVKRIQYEARDEYALLVRHPDRHAYFVYQVPAGQRWAGLWDFPRFGPPHASSLDGAIRQARQDFGLEIKAGDLATTIRHGVTKYRITLYAHHVHWQSPGPGSLEENQQWQTPEQLQSLPLNTTGRKLANLLAAE